MLNKSPAKRRSNPITAVMMGGRARVDTYLQKMGTGEDRAECVGERQEGGADPWSKWKR